MGARGIHPTAIGSSIDPKKTSPSGLDLSRLDADAVRSIQRLVSRGFESYLVGGCVRDLLLDRDPKDFDIATAARPQQVKRAFTRNCRIIGRRFKLAHLHFDGNRKILEVATFRSKPVGDDDVVVAETPDDEPVEDSDPLDDELDAAIDPEMEDDRVDLTAEDDESDPDEEPFDDLDDEAYGEPYGEPYGERYDGDEDEAAGPNEEGDDEEDDDEDDEDDEDDPDADEDEPEDSEEDDYEDEDGDSFAPPPGADLLIVHDNEFGTVEEDAVRRDFTINALFLDPVEDVIIDYVGGIQDVADRVIRTIGDPQVRFREDPVRILRAAKFAGRLGFHFDGPTEAAMRATCADLSRAAPPRLLEEILRLLRGGHALPSFQILRDIGGLAVLLPHVDRYLSAADADERRVFWRLLDALDNLIHSGRAPSTAVGLGCLFLRPVLRLVEDDGNRSLTSAVEEVIGPLAQELRLPRRDAGSLKRICAVHPRFTATGKRRFRLASFLQDPYLPEALQLFELSCYAEEANFEQLEHWRALVAEHAPAPAPAEPRSRRSRSRRGRRDRKPGERRDGRNARDGRDGREGRDSQDRDGGRRGRKKAKQVVQQAPKASKKARNRGRKRKEDEVLTIEPEAYDLSAFDRELAPREVPRFDTIVEGQPGKRRRRPQMNEQDTYTPPPPPGAEPHRPPPPPTSDDVFGDW